jgi:hypothetical protein
MDRLKQYSFPFFLVIVLLAGLPLIPGKAFNNDLSILAARPGRKEVCILCEKSFTVWDRGMKTDSQGRTYIAYGGDHLYMAWTDQQAWQLETVDTANMVGANAVLDIGPDDRVHIVYQDHLNGTMRYAFQSDGGWQIETVDPAGSAVGALSFSLDSAGNPHVSYIDLETQFLMMAVKDADIWRTNIVDDQGSAGWGNSLVVDSRNFSHISYVDALNGVVKYAYEMGDGWMIEEVASIDTASQILTSLAMDMDNNPGIAFTSGDSELYLARKDARGWNLILVDDETMDPFNCSLGFDQSGRWHLGFGAFEPNENNEALFYAFESESGIEVMLVDLESDAGSSITLSFDSQQAVQMAYTRENDLHLVTRVEADWEHDLVDSGRSVSSSHALALDAEDHAHFVFTEYPRSITYIYQDDGGLHDEVIASHEGRGFFDQAAIALDIDGNPHVAYLDFSGEHALKYAVRSDGGWKIETVDKLPPDKNAIAIVVDRDRKPYIAASSDSVPGVTLYALTDRGWEKRKLDAGEGEWIYVDVDLTLDSADRIHIAYNVPGSGLLRYAMNQNDRLVIEDIPLRNPPAADLALAVGPDDQPVISYRSETGDGLFLVKKTGRNWEANRIYQEGGFENVLDIAPDGTLHLSFRDEEGTKLYYLAYYGNFWKTNIVSIPQSQVSQTQIVVGSDNLARISYIDGGLFDLKYLDIVQVEDISISYLPMVATNSFRR